MQATTLICTGIALVVATGCGHRAIAGLCEETDGDDALGESTDAPARAPARGPPYWRSRVLRRAAGEVSVA